MLTEFDVIKAVCQFLTAHGYRVERYLSESQRGDDIVALSLEGKKVMIEAKGQTSSKSHTLRYGKPFDSAQVRTHVSEAFYRAASYAGKGVLAGIALPKTEAHVRCVESIRPAREKLNIAVFWVRPDDREAEFVDNWRA